MHRHHRPAATANGAASLVSSLVLGLIATCGAVSAQEPTPANVEAAVATLGTPSFTERERQTLRASAASCVPALVEILAAHETQPPARTSAALFVLGELGADAARSLEHILEVYALGLQPEVRRQALWAIGQVAPRVARDPIEACRRAREIVEQQAATDADPFLLATVVTRLQLGHAPTNDQLTEALRSAGPAQTIAVCDAITARAIAPTDGSRELLAQIDDMLDASLEPLLRPWLADPHLSAAVPDLGSTLWRHDTQSENAARAMLRHWDGQVRAAALRHLARTSAPSMSARRDVAPTLWDALPAVRALARQTAEGWGAQATVLLPALDLHTRGAAEAEARSATIAARQIVDRHERADTREALALLRATVATPAPAPGERLPEDADASAIAAFVIGCRDVAAHRLPALAELCHASARTDPEVLDAFLACLGTRDADGWSAAATALTRLGPALARRVHDLPECLMRSSRDARVPARFALPILALVHAGPAATNDELFAALEHDSWHVVRRALCELCDRRAPLDAEQQRAVRRCIDRDFAPVVLDEGGVWITNGLEQRVRKVTAPVLRTPTIAACSLALLAGGGDLRSEPRLRRACAEAFDVPEQEVEHLLQRELRAGSIARRVAHLEADMPQLAPVPADDPR